MSKPSPQAPPPPLLPCPFCGSTDINEYTDATDRQFVQCQRCGSHTAHCSSADPASARQHAIELWNHRAPKPPAPAGGSDEKGPYTWIKYYTTPVERPPFTLPAEFYEPDESEPPPAPAAQPRGTVPYEEFVKMTDCGGYYCSEDVGHIDCKPPATAPAPSSGTVSDKLEQQLDRAERLTKSYREHLSERLTTLEAIGGYLEAVIEDYDAQVLLGAVQNVIAAWKDSQASGGPSSGGISDGGSMRQKAFYRDVNKPGRELVVALEDAEVLERESQQHKADALRTFRELAAINEELAAAHQRIQELELIDEWIETMAKISHEEHISELCGTIESLEASLATARQEQQGAQAIIDYMRDEYSMTSAKGCLLCVYDDGVFVRSCQLHLEMDWWVNSLRGIKSTSQLEALLPPATATGEGENA